MSIREEDISVSHQRKADHIDLAFQSQVSAARVDPRFSYEPMLAPHPDSEMDLSLDFVGRRLKFPIWVSSMTGGTEHASQINRNLAMMCGEFGFGMGLGSCRSLLGGIDSLPDFDVRQYIGPDLPLYANLGVAQVEQELIAGSVDRINRMVDTLQVDGLILHVNPLQEAMQPEGDRFEQSPLETLQQLLESTNIPIIVKEVGQGMGPESIRSVLRLPVAAFEMAAHGGTNFTRLELLRSDPQAADTYEQMSMVGHTAEDMVGFINALVETDESSIKCRQVIISGGIRGFLDGYYYMNSLNLPSVYGHASQFLKYAREDYRTLQRFAELQIEGLRLAHACLRVR